MNVIEELKGNYEEAAKLWEDYEKRLNTFRSAVKNDIASLEAGARKTTEAVQRMNKSYGDVVAQMTSHDMERAIQNAERLASALTAISAVSARALTLSIGDPASPYQQRATGT